MRMHIKAIAILMALTAFGPVAFSQENSKGFKTQEISAGIGGLSFWPLVANIGCDSHEPQGMLESLYGKKYGDEHYTPSFSISYNYFTKKHLSFKTRISYCASYNYVYTGIDSHVDYLDVSPCVNIMELIQFTYLNKEKVRLYSSVGAGISLYDGVLPAIQFTLFGVSFGKRIFGFVEYGSGMEYLLLHGGIGYRF